MLWKDGDSDICSLSSQLCHGKGTPFHKYINSKGTLVEQNASQYLISESYDLIGRAGGRG